jgi:hypothetical protein
VEVRTEVRVLLIPYPAQQPFSDTSNGLAESRVLKHITWYIGISSLLHQHLCTSPKSIVAPPSLPLEHVQVRERTQRAHALVVRAHDLLVVEEDPAGVRADVRNVVARVHGRALVRDERLQAVARGRRRVSADLALRRLRGCGGGGGLLAGVVRVREEPLDRTLRAPALRQSGQCPPQSIRGGGPPSPAAPCAPARP